MENSFENPRAENGLAIIMDDTDCVPAVFGIRIGLSTIGDLVQGGGERFGVAGQAAAVLVGVEFAGAGDGHLDQRGADRHENRAQQHADQTEGAGGVVTVVAATAAEIHERVSQIRDDSRQCGGYGGGEDVVVVHVHKLVAEDTANLALVEYVEDTLRAAYGCMALVAAVANALGLMVGAT